MEPSFDKLKVNSSSFKFGLTFDDVLLTPGFSDFSRKDINLSTKFSRRIKISIPLVSAPMDTVTESKLAIELAKLGGIGIIHRNLTIEDQVFEVKKVKNRKLLVGAAVGASKGFEERVKALIKAKTDVIVLDSAHGFTNVMISAIRFIKKTYPKIDIIAGNIATANGARALIAAGADGLRVGMGPGAICTTRIISGMGVPQITVMMGGFFAASLEAPGKLITLNQQELPSRFQKISQIKKYYQFKEYRGMGSEGAMKKGTQIRSEDEFHGKNYKDRVLVAEGVEGFVQVKGKVSDLVDQAIGRIKSGMYYVGAKNILELWKKAKFIRITQASLTESHPHDIFITNPGKNYA